MEIKYWNSSKTFNEEDIKKYEYNYYYENQGDNITNNGPFRFNLVDVNQSLHLHNAQLEIQLLIKNGNNKLTNNDKVSFVNTGNLFSEFKLEINKTLIERIEFPDFLRHILGLIRFNKSYVKGEGLSSLFYPDTSEDISKPIYYNSNIDPALDTPANIKNVIGRLDFNKKYNKGFEERCSLTSEGESITIRIPLKYYSGFIYQHKEIFRGCQIYFEFSRNKDNEMLYTNVKNNPFNVTFEKMKLFIPNVELHPDKEGEMLSSITNDLKLFWTSGNVSVSNEFESMSGSVKVINSSYEISQILVIPQYSERLNDQSKNNMIFDNLNLRSCYLKIANVQHPSIHYEVNFSSPKNWLTYYNELLRAGGKTDYSDGPLISYKNYDKLYPIIAFNLGAHEKYTSISSLDIIFNFNLAVAPTKKFKFYFIIIDKREGSCNFKNQNFRILSTV
jgi:hypothetical protein